MFRALLVSLVMVSYLNRPHCLQHRVGESTIDQVTGGSYEIPSRDLGGSWISYSRLLGSLRICHPGLHDSL